MKKINKIIQTVSAALVIGIMLFSSPVSAAISTQCGCNTTLTTAYGSARTRCGVNGTTYYVYARAYSQYHYAYNSLYDASGIRRAYVYSYNTIENMDSAAVGGILEIHTHPASFAQTSR